MQIMKAQKYNFLNPGSFIQSTLARCGASACAISTSSLLIACTLLTILGKASHQNGNNGNLICSDDRKQKGRLRKQIQNLGAAVYKRLHDEHTLCAGRLQLSLNRLALYEYHICLSW